MKYWMALAALLVALIALTGCGGDDSDEGGRIGAIGDLSEKAVDAWTRRGATGLHNLLHPAVRNRCSVDGLEAVLADQPTPADWRETRNITFTDDTQAAATATVVIATDGQDVEQTWGFELEENVRWRVSDFPGLAGCNS